MGKINKEEIQYILVNRKDVANAIKTQCMADYMILFLTSIVSVRKLSLTMTTKDVCEILQMDFDTFETYRLKMKIPYTQYGDLRLYELMDMVKLAETITRMKRHRQLCCVPTAMTVKPK